MTGRTLAFLLLASAAARADKAWIFEPGQALVSVEMGPSRARVSLTSPGMSGRVVELSEGGVEAGVRVRLASFSSGTPARDAQVRRDSEAASFPEVVFEGAAPGAGKNGALRLAGTLTLHGVSRPLSVPVTVVRASGMTFGHVVMTLHLRDFGFALPEPLSDEVRIEVDAGLRPEGALASRG